MYWSHSLHDLQELTSLHMQFEIIKSMAATESLIIVAAKVFGGGKSAENHHVISDYESMKRFGGIP